MSLTDLPTWIEEVSGQGFLWYVKRLSGNDTLANDAHQAGPYIQKEFLFDVFPSLYQPSVYNPDKWFEVRVDSHPDARRVRAVWYNNKLTRNKTRNEARVTNFGGGGSALLDPESTGALTVFAFLRQASGEADTCHVWVCRDPLEEDLIEERIGEVEPGKWKTWAPDVQTFAPASAPTISRSCWLAPSIIPTAWLTRFPTGAEIIQKTVELQPLRGMNVDLRLTKRRECEYNIFLSIEEAVELPRIKQGFASMDEFTTYANSIMQRRKSRSGNSLELHLRDIFIEEGLKSDVDFSFRPKAEDDKRPDFLFPSQRDYEDLKFPESSLRMLAVKTTCKDRWRQILTEANRVQEKHLLTLQEGISEKQFQEMRAAGVILVVPSSIVGTYAKSIRPHLLSLESFIADLRLLNA